MNNYSEAQMSEKPRKYKKDNKSVPSRQKSNLTIGNLKLLIYERQRYGVNPTNKIY